MILIILPLILLIWRCAYWTVKLFASWFAQVGQTLKMAVVQTAYANGSSTHYLEETLKVFSFLIPGSFLQRLFTANLFTRKIKATII